MSQKSYSRSEIAELAGVSATVVTHWITSGMLPAWDASAFDDNPNKHWRVLESDWDRFVQSKKTGNGQQSASTFPVEKPLRFITKPS